MMTGRKYVYRALRRAPAAVLPLAAHYGLVVWTTHPHSSWTSSTPHTPCLPAYGKEPTTAIPTWGSPIPRSPTRNISTPTSRRIPLHSSMMLSLQCYRRTTIVTDTHQARDRPPSNAPHFQIVGATATLLNQKDRVMKLLGMTRRVVCRKHVSAARALLSRQTIAVAAGGTALQAFKRRLTK